MSTGKMKLLVCGVLASLLLEVWSQCLDINGRSISQDFHYVPGPDACTLCVCDNGLPKLCKAVLCAPPPECQSFSRVGKSCCNFTCLDEALHKREELGTDLGLRILVSAVAAILSLSLLFFLVHRLRQRKTIGRQTRAIRSEHRGLSSIGYITGSLGYLPENYFAGADGFDRHIEFCYEEPPSHLSLWKPPGHATSYFPRGEAPPPYEEAVAHPRAELTITASSTLPNISHRTIPLNLTAPGTIRIIHPHQRRGQDPGLATLPRAPGKIRDAAASTLQINISSCGFHTVQSSGDGTAQILPPPEMTDAAIGADALYEPMSGFPLTEANPRSPSPPVRELELPGPSQVSRDQSPPPDTDQDDHDDHDDFRPECENCKSSDGGGSAYYDQEELDPPETMTLQRLPRETDEEPYYRTSLTLPTHCRKPRSVLGSREGWFSAMPESSSEDD